MKDRKRVNDRELQAFALPMTGPSFAWLQPQRDDEPQEKGDLVGAGMS